jgi:F-type H+-transporting ATPase subunit delta
LTRNFVGLLFDRRREHVLVGLPAAFRRLRLEQTGAIEGTVESARALGASELDSLASALGARLGKTVHLENRVDPDLIGGFRVFIGSRLLDRSVAGRIDGLRTRLMNAPLPVSSAS